jgi:hypothetical protein
MSLVKFGMRGGGALSGGAVSLVLYAALMYGVCRFENRAGTCKIPASPTIIVEKPCAEDKNLLMASIAMALAAMLGLKTDNEEIESKRKREQFLEEGIQSLNEKISKPIQVLQTIATEIEQREEREPQEREGGEKSPEEKARIKEEIARRGEENRKRLLAEREAERQSTAQPKKRTRPRNAEQ